ncbi:MAG: DJ-1/PfpI family protein [Candidatus Margulisiibacteriota bacterium]
MPKKAIMVIAPKMFRDEEYLEPKKVLEDAGIEVKTASSKICIASGKLGAAAQVDLLLKDINVSDYDAVLFVGGPGSHDYFDDPDAHRIAKETVAENKILGGICSATGILAKAGVLKGKKSTIFQGEIELLKEKGGIYTGKGVESDGKIFTADGPMSAKAWGEAILKGLGN